MKQQYIAIDLKSFYASVECVERGLDPLDANLVVADKSRTEKTICLAVSPSLKAYGIPGRARLFEVVQKVGEINARRLAFAPGRSFLTRSASDKFLKSHPEAELEYIVAKPRMAQYIKVSTQIYDIYLRYIAPEDIYVYSIDEVFIDAAPYLNTYRLSAAQLAEKLVREVLRETGITATAGVGTNLFLCKVAMDVVAKHIKADRDGVRIAELDEESFRHKLWAHRPITDIWRIGRGYATKLERYGMFTLGDVARCSVVNEELLYGLFGRNAELLIDHAWGWEPCPLSEVKAYVPETKSLSSGQVLSRPYECDETRLIVREMSELLALDLVEKGLVTDQIVLTVGYDIQNLKTREQVSAYRGEITADYYGRLVPKHAHGTENIGAFTSSSRLIVEAALRLFDRIIDKSLLARRVIIVANHTINESESRGVQLSLLPDSDFSLEREPELEKEKSIQRAVLSLQRRYGKNAVVKGMNLFDSATSIERNGQIGGHRA